MLLESATATYGMVITVGRKGRRSGLHYFNARQRSALFIKWNGEPLWRMDVLKRLKAKREERSPMSTASCP